MYCEIHPFNFPLAKIRALAPRGIILSGGPASLYDENAPDLDPEVLKSDAPILGICYGMYVVATHLGAKTPPSQAKEYGPATLQIDAPDPLFEGLEGQEHRVWMSHGDRVESLPSIVAIDRAYRECSVRCGAQYRRQNSRHPVSSRSGAYAVRDAGVAQLRAQDLRRARRLDDGEFHRYQGRRDSREGRRARQGAARAFRRRRFVGRGRADSSRDRRSPQVRVRRHRTAARGRARANGKCFRRPARHRPDRHRRIRVVPQATRRRARSRTEAPHHRAYVHRRVRVRRCGARRAFPRSGHSISRRDRIGVVQRAVRRHQEPS